jgi:hypothetical protein
MTEQVTPGEVPQTPDATTEQPAGVTPEALKVELEQARAALKLANREAAERRKKLEAYEKAEQDKAAAEMTEAQKLAKQLEEATGKLRAMETNEIRRKVAAKHNLPDALALRLQGATEEEMEADAKALAEILPKPQPKQPGPQPANPGANGSQGETVQQRLNRIHGGGGGAFDFKENS